MSGTSARTSLPAKQTSVFALNVFISYNKVAIKEMIIHIIKVLLE